MLQGRSPPQISPTQVREGRYMAGAEASKGQGAPLGRTKGTREGNLSDCVTHTTRL